MGLQGITAQSTTEADLVEAALAIREAFYCANNMKEPRTDARMGTVDRNWTKSVGRLLSHGGGVSLRKSHTTRNDAVPGVSLHRT